MTLPVERSRTRRPVTWLTIVGVLLLPVVIGALLVTALYNPADRLENMTAAIVNDDAPVTVNGQLAPLGRQLTAGLVKGSDTQPSNLTWVISNSSDAASGLADGTYSAVVTIPEDFSAAATSTAGSSPQQATIQVQTATDAKVVDDAITAQITQAAASLMGQQLSQVYLENVLLGFTTLGDKLGQAASGAHELAAGTSQLGTGADALASGVGDLSTGASQLAGGASQLSDGASRLATGATQAAGGLSAWAGGAQTLASGSSDIADALQQVADQVPQDMPQVPQQVIDTAKDVAADSAQINRQLTDAANSLSALAADCEPATTPELCAALTRAAQDAQASLSTATGIVDQAGTIATGLEGLNQLPRLGAGLSELAAQQRQIAAGMQGLAGGATQAAAGVGQLADGAAGLSTGAAQLSAGASQLADGASQATSGAAQLATGARQAASGTSSLADGLDQAVAQIPRYSDAQAKSLATVVSDPVAAQGETTNLFGASAIPLLAMLVLWFGGLASYVVFRAVSGAALTSRAPSALLALRGFAPGAIAGAVQGVLVAAVVQVAASYDWADWSLFAAVCVVAGIAFAAVNQALVALLGGAGRWIAAVIGALAVATGVVSTVPGALAGVATLAPTWPAYTAMLGALTPAGGTGAALVGLAVWTVLALVTTVIVVARRRRTSARAVLAAS
ncbi:YhgE/Pip family protein [Microbacterium sp. SORGH_AS_0888]|uniref:YhgE/Pip family protein n=1 Tax=Microbacterium sp. SORGH_AS_0888 TaxID=3041791 RepID=UPI0027857C72|nr:YhgE/Pip family protein [Microbacterium sp. SORGH_AS_0888]MDQ1130642.1 putative membrane protein [Microbacterium sp. SORGH_AS_0888]